MANYSSTTYSFADVDVTFTHPAVGVHQVNGEGLGSITITMAQDKTSHDIAADGSVMISKIAGENGTIALNIQQTSSFHKWLLGWYNFINLAEGASWALASIIIRDKVNGTTITALDVSPQKRADKGYQAQGQQVTWNMMAGNITEVPF